MCADVGTINSQTLSELFAVTAAANHFHQVSWQEEQKPDRPKQVVDKTDHSSADCGLRIGERNSTSVAPYVFWRATRHNSVSERFSPGRFSKTNKPLTTSN